MRAVWCTLVQNTTWKQPKISQKPHHGDKPRLRTGNSERHRSRDGKSIKDICTRMSIEALIERCSDGSEHHDYTWKQGVYLYIVWLQRSNTRCSETQRIQTLSPAICYCVPPMNSHNNACCEHQVLQSPDMKSQKFQSPRFQASAGKTRCRPRNICN
jgi:hypothetical protein